MSAFEVVGEESRERGARARARRARPSAGGLFFERGKERFEDARRAAPAVNDGCFRVNKKRLVFLVRAPRSARLAFPRRRRISGAASFRRATVFAIVFLREIFRVRQTDRHTKKVSSETIFQERFPYVARKNEKDGIFAASRFRRAPESYAAQVRPRRIPANPCLTRIGNFRVGLTGTHTIWDFRGDDQMAHVSARPRLRHLPVTCPSARTPRRFQHFHDR